VAEVKAVTPADPKQNTQQIAALPIGGRVKLDPWFDRLDLLKSKPVGAIAEREKMPFEITPFMPYLTRYGNDATKPINASATGATNPDAAAANSADPNTANPPNKP
jgi:hypothetical protein